MKKYLVALLLLFSTASAEMIWIGLDPTVKASNASSESAITSGGISLARTGKAAIDGSDIFLTVNDSSANADSTYIVLYSEIIKTHGVVSATGLINVSAITDTSTDSKSPFTQYGDSISVAYQLKTADIEYAATSFDLIAYGDLTATSGTAVSVPITLVPATANVDTLFKAYTWFEITFTDSTRWIDLYSQYFRVSGSGDSATTIAGTYNTTGFDVYKYWIIDPGADDDSIGWCHADPVTLANTGTIDTLDITASAQDLDSGMTINFVAGVGHTDKDTFMFVVSDSLHYGKRTDFTVRMGLNLKR